jgi:hypothetical protein
VVEEALALPQLALLADLVAAALVLAHILPHMPERLRKVTLAVMV